MKLFLALATAFLFGASGMVLAEQTSDTLSKPVVVELFTSQGCSSCPPADALLKQMAQRPDVIALALHVDYWDYIGWKDIFASPSNTNRQKGYAQVGGRKMIYTPQMIVMGQQDVSGSDAMGLAKAISDFQSVPNPVALEVQRGNGRLMVSVAPLVALPEAPVLIQMLGYTPLDTVNITRGELAGHEIEYSNIVKDLRELAIWDGQQSAVFETDFDETQPAVILVQQAPFGAILAASRIP
ncbi:MAG: DUF1223 domain-containing protein [Roseobacter sp. MedPE-SW]|nr:MAG: DUF1223 domain-containing protein [Roseobacter sp. MedPE-SW]